MMEGGVHMLKSVGDGRALLARVMGKSEVAPSTERKAAAASESWEDSVHPWLPGAIEWSERYGSLLAEARRWRLVAMFALGLAGVSVWGAITLAQSSKVVPYIVQVDKHGFTVPIRPAERSTAQDERNVLSAASKWVRETRTVIGNADAQYELVQEAYAKMAKGSSAWHKANAWMVAHNPMDQVGNKRVEVEVTRAFTMGTISQVTVEWTEREYKQSAVVESRFSAYLSIEVSPPVRLDDVIANPAGVFIADYSISQL
jgi:type IV secretion system protein VirB5